MFKKKSNEKNTYGIVGLGRFGHALALELAAAGADLVVLDKEEEKVRELREYTENAYVVHALDKKTLSETGVQNCDVAVVCIGEQLDISILTTLNLVSLGVPTVIVRRDSKVYEGPAVNINYLSGSGSRVETMSLSRRAVKEGQRALIVDDFMRAGGTARGMVDMMREFSVTVVGVCVLISTQEPAKKRLDGVKSLLVIEEADESTGSANIRPANWLSQAVEKNKA